MAEMVMDLCMVGEEHSGCVLVQTWIERIGNSARDSDAGEAMVL